MKYFAAVFSAVVAALMSYLALPLLGVGVMTFFSVAVLVSALYSGLVAALIVATAGVLINSYWFMPPLHSFRISREADFAFVVLLYVLAFLANRERVSKLRLSKTLAARNNELEAVLALVCPRCPVCSECGKFQTDVGEWASLSDYVHQQYPARHVSFCPDCVKSLHLQAQEDLTGDAA